MGGKVVEELPDACDKPFTAVSCLRGTNWVAERRDCGQLWMLACRGDLSSSLLTETVSKDVAEAVTRYEPPFLPFFRT
jgi:hypothetical protein